MTVLDTQCVFEKRRAGMEVVMRPANARERRMKQVDKKEKKTGDKSRGKPQLQKHLK